MDRRPQACGADVPRSPPHRETSNVTNSITHRILVSLCLALIATPGLALSPVEDLVQRKAEILRIVHKKAKKALANAAQDRAFAGYFTSPDQASRDSYKERIDRIALGVQRRFDAEEMCLIDPRGNEISRIVGDRVAHDLSHEEAHANFFAPGFAHRPRSVYISPVYLSEDSNKWVVAYVTPIVVADSKRAILHYEHGLDGFQRKLNRDLEGNDVFLLTVDADGFVIADSRRPIAIAARGHRHANGDYFRRFEFGGASLEDARARIADTHMLSDADGRRYQAAYATVEDWTLLAFRAADTGAMP